MTSRSLIPLAWTTTLLLIVAGEAVMYWLLRDHPLLPWLMAGLLVIGLVFLSLKLMLLRSLMRSAPGTTQDGTAGTSTESSDKE